MIDCSIARRIDSEKQKQKAGVGKLAILTAFSRLIFSDFFFFTLLLIMESYKDLMTNGTLTLVPM